MRPETIRKLRWTFSILTLSMVIWIAWSYYYSTTSLQNAPVEKVSLLEKDVLKSSERIEYSQMQENQVVFRISAQRYIQTSNGTNQLEGIRAVNFGKNGERLDSIESRSGRYDPKLQFVSFLGHVVIRTKEGAEILTESLSYAQSDETAQTEDSFQFRSGDIAGQGRGFIYDFRGGALQILQGADFRLVGSQRIGSGSAPAEALEIHSSRAVLNREYLFQFSGNAAISQGSTRLDADEIQVQFDSGGHILHSILARRSARLTLDPGQEEKSFHQAMGGESITMRFTSETNQLESVIAEDQAFFAFHRVSEPPIRLDAASIRLSLDSTGQPEKLQASDDAEISQAKPGNLMWLQGGGLAMDFQSGQRTPHSMHFDKPCRARMSQADRLVEMWASQMDAAFSGGAVASFDIIHAQQALVWVTPRIVPPPASIRDLRERERLADHVHRFSGNRIEIEFEKGGNHPAILRGDLKVQLESKFFRGQEQGLRLIDAEQMSIRFNPGSSNIQSIQAGPDFRMRETVGPSSRHFRSEQAQAEFSSPSNQITRAEFRGDFRFEQAELRATSDTATYENANDRIRLEGSPRLWDSQAQTTARVLEVHGQGTEIRGKGAVRSVFSGQSRDTLPLPGAAIKPAKSKEQEIIIVTGETLEANRKEKKAIYSGSAKASQGPDYIKSETLKIDQADQTLEAQGKVEMELSSSIAEQPGKRSSPIRAYASNMIYAKLQSQMDLRGSVQLVDGELQVLSERMTIQFHPESQTLSRMIATEQVRILKAGWLGSGDESEYLIAEKRLLLKGKPAEIKDSGGRRSLGRRLTMYMADDRLSVEN